MNASAVSPDALSAEPILKPCQDSWLGIRWRNFMISKNPRLLFLWLMIWLAASALCGFFTPDLYGQQTASPIQTQPNADVRGTWSGTFFSKNSNTAPFTMTVVITGNSDAPSGSPLTAGSSLNSDCMKNAKLVVTVNGANVIIAGSDQDGDNITVRGTVDNTGALLKATYVINGSASGRCETDNGTGNLAKR
jgi:hypothetical protein